MRCPAVDILSEHLESGTLLHQAYIVAAERLLSGDQAALDHADWIRECSTDMARRMVRYEQHKGREQNAAELRRQLWFLIQYAYDDAGQ